MLAVFLLEFLLPFHVGHYTTLFLVPLVNRTLVDSQFTCNFGHSMSLFNFFEDINALALAKRTFIWELKSKINSNSILSDVSEEGQDILENYFWTYKIKLHLPDFCRASRTFLNPYVVRSQFPPPFDEKIIQYFNNHTTFVTKQTPVI